MKNIYPNIYTFNKKILKKTANYLKLGNIAGIPTETVYGLAGNAYSKKAVQKIFHLKNRPKKNPLIIHYNSITSLKKDVILNKTFLKLYKKYCPGPLTFVLKKNNKSKVVSLASAGLNTIAVRFPDHKIIKSLLKIINFPLAMPSANLSSGLSPVSASDVYEEFKRKLKIIIDGGNSRVGIESTVIDLTKKPKILRPGVISSKEIKKYLGVSFSKKNKTIRSPGMMKKHYSPGIPIILGRNARNLNHAQITFGKNNKNNKNNFNLSKKGDLKEAAANLYKIMRKIKKKGFKKIFISKIPNKGPGIAINDRIKRASK